MSDSGKSLFDDLLLEEYRHVCRDITEFQNRYSKLEALTISGFFLIYGYALDENRHFLGIIWWVIPLVLSIPAARCLAYYLIIIRRISPYIKTIEDFVYKEKIEGYQNFMRKDDAVYLNLAFNVVAWVVILGIAFGIAILKQCPSGQCSLNG